MARHRLRFRENVPGEFFVEPSCIDCDTCRQLAPEVFAERAQGQSFVYRQPVTDDERHRALMALVACPTSAIGTEPKTDVSAAISAFPSPIDGDVSYCGFVSEETFGGSAYFIRRAAGNVLIDSPRAAAPLMKRLEEQGGVAWMFLTHRDDVGAHAQYRERFGSTRLIHEADAHGADLERVERKLSGTEPTQLAPDLLAIPVPGHTAGSTALLYAGRYLFTGDHLWWSEKERRLEADRNVCWWSWKEQRASLKRLLDFDFEWVLPGHGRRFHAATPATMRRELERLIAALD